ncbi:hypothetical protein [Nocardia bovistercoris]|uniref:Uncharacterized protein n=1 Tax=Nocardia bovistercoris TaxID=2785916 RepID=A0A931I4G7_9NOCA|nr:hypothetical protein [Nocardia bovistercoris]MBH0774702.1 hypothetical protein [Nocardia bovistercoris]
MTSSVVLEAPHVTYYSPQDEAIFFGWLDKIDCVTSYRGELRTLYLTIDPARADHDALRELVALYRRYHIDLRELHPLTADRVGPWFSDQARWWHAEVFG